MSFLFLDEQSELLQTTAFCKKPEKLALWSTVGIQSICSSGEEFKRQDVRVRLSEKKYDQRFFFSKTHDKDINSLLAADPPPLKQQPES